MKFAKIIATALFAIGSIGAAQAADPFKVNEQLNKHSKYRTNIVLASGNFDVKINNTARKCDLLVGYQIATMSDDAAAFAIARATYKCNERLTMGFTANQITDYNTVRKLADRKGLYKQEHRADIFAANLLYVTDFDVAKGIDEYMVYAANTDDEFMPEPKERIRILTSDEEGKKEVGYRDQMMVLTVKQ